MIIFIACLISMLTCIAGGYIVAFTLTAATTLALIGYIAAGIFFVIASAVMAYLAITGK